MRAKMSADLRLDCLRVAMAMATTKVIRPGEVVGYAMEFFRFVDGQETKVDLTGLKEKYKSGG